MFLKQYYLGCLAHASYMIADEKTKIAAVVDPQRDIEQYLADAKAAGYTIKYVFLTHFHADFILNCGIRPGPEFVWANELARSLITRR